MTRFEHFAAIDWSGAVGARQRGIAVATCGPGDEAPVLVRAGQLWSRTDVLEWMLGEMPAGTLVGLDLGASLPFADCGAFFPGWSESPADARALWALVERVAAGDPHLSASSFVDHADAARHFRRHGGRCGDLFPAGRGRLRVTEEAQRAQGLNPYSNFNLVGAAQVGKSSLTGMRLLHRISGRLPIWPFDYAQERPCDYAQDRPFDDTWGRPFDYAEETPFEPLPASGSVVVEIYTSIAAIAGGLPKNRTKIRDPETLDAVLVALGSAPHAALARYDDHATDAMIGAAWLRRIHADPAMWAPPDMSPDLARTEGWTFGVR